MTPRRGLVGSLADDHTSLSVPGRGTAQKRSQPREWVLELPSLSAPPLRDNQRLHWAPKAKITAELRHLAYWTAVGARLPRGLDRVRIVLHWQPSVRRSRDHFSATPTLKPLVDGLTVDYGLVADDDTAHVELGCVIEPVAIPARVWLHITDLGAPQ